MSELQIALIATGAVVVAGVWGYNRLQERAQRKLAEKLFGGSQSDVLLGDKAEEAVVEEIVDRREPVIDEPAAVIETVPPLPEAWADEMADCVVRIDFVDAIPATSLWQAQVPWSSGIGKAVHWLGLDLHLGHWRQLTERDGGRYPVVCASLQLADRRGPASAAEVEAFLDGIKGLTQRFSGLADLPSAEAVLANAKAIDDACVAVDMQLGINLVPINGPSFAVAALCQVLEAGGMTLREDGLFRAADDAFAVANFGGPFDPSSLDLQVSAGVTLTLDVPCVADAPAAFDRLLIVADALTANLDGVLVDGQRNALSVEMIGSIRAKIAELQQQMSQFRIAPGSVRARRLFS